MTNAGYSGTTLIKKLGPTVEQRIAILEEPREYREILRILRDGMEISQRLQNEMAFVQFSTRDRNQLEGRLPYLKNALKTSGKLWISWPKKASNVQTDINENIVREIGLSKGLVELKVAVINEIWSGHKFVYCLEDRSAS